MLFNACSRVVIKISSCWVNTTSRRGIKRLGISFGSIFLLFSNKSSRGPLSQQPGKIPGPRLLMTTLHAVDMKVCINSLDHTELELLHTCESEWFCYNLSPFFVVVSLCSLDVILSSKKIVTTLISILIIISIIISMCFMCSFSIFLVQNDENIIKQKLNHDR